MLMPMIIALACCCNCVGTCQLLGSVAASSSPPLLLFLLLLLLLFLPLLLHHHEYYLLNVNLEMNSTYAIYFKSHNRNSNKPIIGKKRSLDSHPGLPAARQQPLPKSV